MIRNIFGLFLFTLLITACKGGSGGGGSSSQSGESWKVISGVAAEGAPLASKTIYAKDATGTEVTTVTDSSGNFSLNVTGLIFPVILKGEGSTNTFISVAYSDLRTNITPFTSLAVSQLTEVSSASNYYTTFPTVEAITKLGTKSSIDTAVIGIKNKLAIRNINLSSVDILNGVFEAVSGDQYDDLLENLKTYLATNDLSFEDLSEEIITTPVSCDSGYHDESGVCVSNTRICAITNGSGQQVWNTTWSNCNVTSCNQGYEISGNQCVAQSSSGGDQYASVSISDLGIDSAKPSNSDYVTDGYSVILPVPASINVDFTAHFIAPNGEIKTSKIVVDGFPYTFTNPIKFGNFLYGYNGQIHRAPITDPSSMVNVGDSDHHAPVNPSIQVASGKMYFFGRNSSQTATELYVHNPSTGVANLQKVSLTPVFGDGVIYLLGKDSLENLWFAHKKTVSGVLNSVDYYQYNTSTDIFSLIESNPAANSDYIFDPSKLENSLSPMRVLNGRLYYEVSKKINGVTKYFLMTLGNGSVNYHELPPGLQTLGLYTVQEKSAQLDQNLYATVVSGFDVKFYKFNELTGVTLQHTLTGGYNPPTNTTAMYASKSVTAGQEAVYSIIENAGTSYAAYLYKITPTSVTKVLDIPAATSNMFDLDGDSNGDVINWYNKNIHYLKGSLILATRRADGRDKLLRIRLDNGVVEFIKTDFYYNANDGKSINALSKLQTSESVLVYGESSATNGSYSTVWKLE